MHFFLFEGISKSLYPLCPAMAVQQMLHNSLKALWRLLSESLLSCSYWSATCFILFWNLESINSLCGVLTGDCWFYEVLCFVDVWLFPFMLEQHWKLCWIQTTTLYCFMHLVPFMFFLHLMNEGFFLENGILLPLAWC